MLIDTHAHTNFTAFKGETDEVIERALNGGVFVVNVGTQMDTSASAVEVAKKYDQGVYAVVGLHPVHTYSQELDEEESHFRTREEQFDYSYYKNLASSDKVVGIGECGLDYYRLLVEDLGEKVSEIKLNQKKAFEEQIKLAKELNKALVIHCRPSKEAQDAYEDILAILDQIGAENLRFEIHSFTGSPKIAKEFVSRGAYVGLNGIITFDKTGNMQDVVNQVPLEKIVLETDCPYLTPVPHRGKKNEPLYARFIAEKLAELKRVPMEEVEAQTTKNAQSLFQIKV